MAEPTAPSVSSRRLMGANFYSARPGAVLEVVHDGSPIAQRDVRAAIELWPIHARALASAIGWQDPVLTVVRGARDGSCFLSAPVDALMTATVLAEQAWRLATLELSLPVASNSPRAGADAPAPDVEMATVITQLRAQCAAEQAAAPGLADAERWAHAAGVSFGFDDDTTRVGSGPVGLHWPTGAVPPADIASRHVTDIPIALVTGSNGKTTTTRMLAAMFRAAGQRAGWSCSDGVYISDGAAVVMTESGDYTGPGGALSVLTNRDAEAAVLETARGGLLRRGLGTSRAQVAVITNIAEDHFGEYGVHSLTDLATVKASIVRAIVPSGHVVLNADDPLLVTTAERIGSMTDAPVVWWSTTPTHPLVHESFTRTGIAARLVDGVLQVAAAGGWYDIVRVDDMPSSVRGTAPHNVANALAASLAAACLGLAPGTISRTLRAFGAEAGDNPGRLQRTLVGGVTVLLDYAHNADGLRTLLATAGAIPATRRLLLLGQAGDRDDVQLQGLARVAGQARFDRIVVKEMPGMLRGRAVGEVPRVLCGELQRGGMEDERVTVAPSELAAVRAALDWAREDDLLVFPIHDDRPAVEALLAALVRQRWQPGHALP
ncbi:MAG: Mur ligase family protein [Gemmatimonadota bacterium]